MRAAISRTPEAPLLFSCFSPPDRKGLLDLMLESAFAMFLHHAPTQYPARAARQRIPPSIPPEQLVTGSRRVPRQSCSPVDPAQYPARAARQWIPPIARQWIPPSSPPASGSRLVSHQSSPPVDCAEYPTEYPRVARQSIPPSIPPHREWIPPSILLSIPCRWILPSIRPVSIQSGSPAFASGSRQSPARASPAGFA